MVKPDSKSDYGLNGTIGYTKSHVKCLNMAKKNDLELFEKN
jgi:hypothetical protein